MDKRLLTYIFILVIALSGCTQAVSITPSNIPTSGIEGYATEGPMCPGPVAIGDTRCQDQPYQATISILAADNQEVTRFQTDTSGYFKITLVPGTYTLHPLSGKTLPRASDQTVIVTPNQYSQVTVIYDTGILSGSTQAVSITPSSDPISGIEGYATQGPMCPGPVAIGDTGCQDQPYQATISILGADNQEVTRFQANPAGYFKITLAPGTYTLHPLTNKTLPRASDQNVVVIPNQFTQVTVVYDTGMR